VRQKPKGKGSAPRRRAKTGRRLGMLAVTVVVALVPLVWFTLREAASTVRGDTLSPAGLERPVPPGIPERLETSPMLREAVVAAEDRRFYTFPAVDPIGIGRAAVVDLSSGSFSQGGSTITEQLMKQLFIKRSLRGQKLLQRRLAEAILATRYAASHNESRILDNYLGTVYFGNGAYGVQEASRTYFGVPASRLDASQAATLAGLIRAPSALDPLQHPRAALQRRNEVLREMESQGFISKAAYEASVRQPLGVSRRVGAA
jgi:membrane peptidoglycan carboxypeptidase